MASPERPHIGCWLVARPLKVRSVGLMGSRQPQRGLQTYGLWFFVEKPAEGQWAALGGGEPLVSGGVQEVLEGWLLGSGLRVGWSQGRPYRGCCAPCWVRRKGSVRAAAPPMAAWLRAFCCNEHSSRIVPDSCHK